MNRGLFCCWLACAALPACRSATYVPTTPRSVSVGSTQLAIERVQLRRGPEQGVDQYRNHFTARLASNWPSSAEKPRIYLSSAYADGCDGDEADVTVTPGKLEARWPYYTPLGFTGPKTIDVRLPAPESRCVRLPLGDGTRQGSLHEVGIGEWLVSWRANGELSSSPVTWSVVSTSLGAGTWVGPLRLMFWTGIGAGHCQRSLCGLTKPADGNKDKAELVSGLTLPVDIDIEGFVWSRHVNALSLTLRPGFRITSFDRKYAPEPARRVAFTPALVASYWTMPPPHARPSLAMFSDMRRTEGGGVALELSFGLWQDLDLNQPSGFYGGIGGRFAFAVD